MRTAEEILKDYNVVGMTELIIPIINEARKEVIIECARVVKLKWVDDNHVRNTSGYVIIDNESILNLIDQVK